MNATQTTKETKMQNTTQATEWVVLVSGSEDGDTFCFIATEGFESEQEALDYTCDNASAYASDWTVEVCTKEDAEQVIEQD
jgi:hypothetical protein